MAIVYLDACAIIETREKPTDVGRALATLIVDCFGSEHTIITSELSLLEVLVDPIRGLVDREPPEEDGAAREFHEWYVENLSSRESLIQTLPITRDVLRQAALVRARKASIRTPDAIHLATARLQSTTHFVTNDDRMRNALQADHAWKRGVQLQFVPMTTQDVQTLTTDLFR
jgi:predicted nucleic acid-binding protein